jgi:2-polyprenyl-3-methyl-5-hydroxy-6-metoxy-1,4-benzoquinol methylase
MSGSFQKNSGSEFSELNSEVQRVWDANAEWWDDRIGDGNAFQCELIEPATERLLQVSPGEVILDVACGAGRFARRMAELGAYVVAFDFSERFIERAKQRTPPEMKNIEYHVADALDEKQVLALGIDRFDAAVATMALMDMASIDPLMRALMKSLKPGGNFLFSVMHPCFKPPESRKFAEQYEGEERVRVIRGIKVTKYLTPTAWKAEGIFGQPELQYYFHRPLSALLRSCFNVGFVIDGVEEPAFKTRGDTREVLTWRDSPEIPPVLVVRMRLLKKEE